MIYKKVYDIVRQIPEGRVLTYGLISHKLGGRLSAQGVGWALKALPKKKKGELADYDSSNVPWHRVINAQGGISTGRIIEIPPDLQKKLLRREGVKFNAEDKVDLAKYLWKEFADDL
ncbi:MAG: MGMT family protein [Cyanobacteria bacterium SZAS LIN-3]|nr:MGMT family protein [Cyanobacteria bacterium SZAS LIN-3]MBS2007983.1 MGMT family protein [Cyanobacteria bacterium SZAS TMP-1]